MGSQFTILDPEFYGDKKLKLDQLGGLELHRRSRSTAQKTVRVFSGIVGKDLKLMDGVGVSKKPETDGTTLYVPLKLENSYSILESLLADVVFRVNSSEVSRFLQSMAKNLCGVGNWPIKTKIGEIGQEVCTYLEDFRVLSLWGRIYEGSYPRILEYRQERARKEVPDPHSCVGGLLRHSSCCAGVGSGRYSCLLPSMMQALGMVEFKGPRALFAAAEWLILEILAILRDTDEPQSEGLPFPDKASVDDLARRMGEGEKRPDHNGPMDDCFDKEDFEEIHRSLDSNEDLHSLLDTSSDEATKKVEEVLRSIKGAGGGSAVGGTPKILDVIQAFGGKGIAPDLSVRQAFLEQETVGRLRRLFKHVRERSIRSLRYQGVEIDIPAYLESRVSKRASPCFRSDRQKTGFQCLILLDRSGSMAIGNKTAQIEAAARILTKALELPRVQLDIWGYQAPEDGRVLITKFPPGCTDFSTGVPKVDGATPIQEAITLGMQHLRTGKGLKHLVLLTDGYPSKFRKTGKRVETDRLMLHVRKAVRMTRQSGIQITCGVLGFTKDKNLDDLYEGLEGIDVGTTVYDVRQSNLTFMFGGPAHWLYIDPSKMGDDLVRLISSSFLKSLRL